MNIEAVITPKRLIKPQIYAYITPTNFTKKGWVKIGYTDRDPDIRIKEQTHTAGIKPRKIWSCDAKFVTGEYFDDHAFHNFLLKHGIEREKGTEWFNFGDNIENSEILFQKFINKNFSGIQKFDGKYYELRNEQKSAVEITAKYFKSNLHGEFLWNAKPRFGKTLTAYNLALEIEAKSVLIVTNRPAIANSWFDDFEKYISEKSNFKFVSESESLKDRPTLSREEYINLLDQDENLRQVVFLSLQDLKGSKYFGGFYDKLHWVAALKWDLLIIDEAHEGVETFKTDIAFEKIKRNFTLHLSGTPFKAIAIGRFSNEQIFNWSYEDEQNAKNKWHYEEKNPYENLPKLNLLTYQMSKMITDEVTLGAQIDDYDLDYAFDLNEFFSTKDDGKFKYEKDVKKWLDTLTANEKYPFSTPELRKNLKHTFWLLNRVSSVLALEKLMRNHPVFENYKIIMAVGNGKNEGDYKNNESSLIKVKDAINKYDKTITLSVGQLTMGITIPEWSAVIILSNVKSPALYMQSAFRSQNPYEWNEELDGQLVRFKKENAYVFDFAPERTLSIVDEFANNLNIETASGGGTSQNREENIKRLLNFFPVIGEDSEGEMVELNASQILTIPKQLKATEVVRRGFMSNLLFLNISGIFQAPAAALDILNQLDYVDQGRVTKTSRSINTDVVDVDEDGEVVIQNEIIVSTHKKVFGEKIFVSDKITLNEEVLVDKGTDNLAKILSDTVMETISTDLKLISEEYKIPNSGSKRIENKVQDEIFTAAKKIYTDFVADKSFKVKEMEIAIQNTTDGTLETEIRKDYEVLIEKVVVEYEEALKTEIVEKVENLKKQIIYEQEIKKSEKVKFSIEEEIRGRLRSFSRTIPSFIMAYGDKNLKLDNFEKYSPNHVFYEVTGITLEQFVFLRDGGYYQENEETRYFEGNLFDKQVFNESIQEFLRKKEQLSNYFDDNEEDIFDYIPPQKTNQIYTPKIIVKNMVKMLEEENMGIYDDPDKTFIDLYMKSGLYITEIVKKLYNSSEMIKIYPDENLRIKHILENQVYGFAPTEIIYNISTNFIFGQLDSNISRGNFICEDATPYIKAGNIKKLIDTHFK